MFEVMLNLRKPDNYSFFDPDSHLSLTMSNPRNIASRITPSILRGLRGDTLIDVNGAIDLKTGLEKVEFQGEKVKDGSNSFEGKVEDDLNLNNNEVEESSKNSEHPANQEIIEESNTQEGSAESSTQESRRKRKQIRKRS